MYPNAKRSDMDDQKQDDGRNPFGACESGHEYFRGGCPDCGADMMA